MEKEITLALKDIQGIVLSGYNHTDYVNYMLIQFQDGDKGREWLSQLIWEITSSEPYKKAPDGSKVKPESLLNIAFTYEGLKVLGLPQQSLDTFSTEFIEGMAEPFRAKQMGDTDDSHPDKWEFGGKTTEPIHAVLMVFGKSKDILDLATTRQRVLFQASQIKEIMTQEGFRPLDRKEHFGFLDGLSQPKIEGGGILLSEPPGPEAIKPGEFIFGYPNEYGMLPSMPGPEMLGLNGTYLVYRKLSQDVGAFKKYVDEQANGDPNDAALIAAKMLGRWPSGLSLAVSPEEDNAVLAADKKKLNDFQFFEADPHGYACPVGSHIRRSNPRDSLEGDPAGSMVIARRHRLLRRGVPYGSPYSEQTVNEARGIVFIALNANIKRQFEFVQAAWVNDPKFAGLYNDRDPITGNNDGLGQMTIQRKPIRRQIQKIPRFVMMKGGAYFFLPGMRALRFIASAGVES
jgi:Dyp-type peroxidase family